MKKNLPIFSGYEPNWDSPIIKKAGLKKAGGGAIWLYD